MRGVGSGRGRRRGIALPCAALALVSLALLAGSSEAAGGSVYWKSYGKPVGVEPHRIDINYSTGYAWATGLTDWKGWGTRTAHADGVLHLNTCRPYCAAGHYRADKGRVTLYKVRRCGRQRRYLDIKVKVTDSARPVSVWGSDCHGAQIRNP